MPSTASSATWPTASSASPLGGSAGTILDEYLLHARQAAGTAEITAAELHDPRTCRRMALPTRPTGKTRTRNTLSGPDAAAYSNSMRVRIDSYNAFAEFLGLPDRHDGEPPARGYYLTPADTERLLHDLAVRRPIHANAATSIRTAAVAALVADTGRAVPELARLNVSALHLEGAAHVELADGSCPLGAATVQILTRWLSARGGDHRGTRGQRPRLPVDPDQARPTPGRSHAVKPGLSRAAVRTLHAAHRNPRQPGTRHAAPARRLPRSRSVRHRPC